jgi:hypothetical protein
MSWLTMLFHKDAFSVLVVSDLASADGKAGGIVSKHDKSVMSTDDPNTTFVLQFQRASGKSCLNTSTKFLILDLSLVLWGMLMHLASVKCPQVALPFSPRQGQQSCQKASMAVFTPGDAWSPHAVGRARARVSVCSAGPWIVGGACLGCFREQTGSLPVRAGEAFEITRSTNQIKEAR